MSIKGFHIVFVTVSMLLFAFLTLWSFVITGEDPAWVFAMRGVGIGGMLLTPVYGIYFLRKIRRNHL